MEVDYRLLAGRVAETLCRVAQSDAGHLAESSYPATTRTDERRPGESRTERRSARAGGLLVVRLRPFRVAARRRRTTLGPRTSLKIAVPALASTSVLS